MKKTIVQIVMGLAIVGLAIWLYSSIMKPVKFESEYNTRRDACAEKLKAIRTLEEAYKTTYHVYCGNFDTLFSRLMNEDSMLVVAKVLNQEKIAHDTIDINELTELEQIKRGYKTLTQQYINPIKHLRDEGKLNLTDEQIRDLRYVPYPKGQKLQFTLAAKTLEKNGMKMPVFECKVDLDDLMSDCDRQLVVNKKDELDKASKYAGWKVGSLDEAITDGNFE